MCEEWHKTFRPNILIFCYLGYLKMKRYIKIEMFKREKKQNKQMLLQLNLMNHSNNSWKF